jgi:hypothetical protein
MLIHSCVRCEFHQIKEQEGTRVSYCGKENCWSRYSKCIALKALDWFLEAEAEDRPRHFSALDHVYSDET